MNNNFSDPRVSIPEFILKRYKPLFNMFLISLIYIFWIGFMFFKINSWHSFIQIFLYATTYVVVVHLNIYVLFKRYFLKGKTYQYLWASLLSFFLASLVLQSIYAPSWPAYFHSFSNADFAVEIIITGIICITFTCVGLAFRLMGMWLISEQKIAAMANANLTSELENLKNQLSPHFLFNTLNNVYVLTKTNHMLAADMILELSDLLKYQLYDCSTERVPLAKELKYMKNMLALEQLRKDQWQVAVHFPELLPEHTHVPPLLFINLVENAIKHGMQQNVSGKIDISLYITGNSLIFSISNTKPARIMPSVNDKKIGLQNLRRRLKLLYPDRHLLLIADTQELYTAKLTIHL